MGERAARLLRVHALVDDAERTLAEQRRALHLDDLWRCDERAHCDVEVQPQNDVLGAELDVEEEQNLGVEEVGGWRAYAGVVLGDLMCAPRPDIICSVSLPVRACQFEHSARSFGG